MNLGGKSMDWLYNVELYTEICWAFVIFIYIMSNFYQFIADSIHIFLFKKKIYYYSRQI